MKKKRYVANVLYHVASVFLHKLFVLFFALKFTTRFLFRIVIHDFSKLSSSESIYFFRVIHKLRGMTYGSEEYRKNLEEIKPALAHHYKHNRHHPEHYDASNPTVAHMDIVDFVEMFCDWQAAVLRHKNGNIKKSIEINTSRYKMSLDLAQVLNNSVKK